MADGQAEQQAPVCPFPRYGFGAVLRDRHGFTGRVVVVYENLDAAIDALAVPSRWFDMQKLPPSSKTQRFYAVNGTRGAVLVGEQDAQLIADAAYLMLAHEMNHGVIDERASVVRWLRYGGSALVAAEAIGRGEHRGLYLPPPPTGGTDG